MTFNFRRKLRGIIDKLVKLYGYASFSFIYGGKLLGKKQKKDNYRE